MAAGTIPAGVNWAAGGSSMTRRRTRHSRLHPAWPQGRACSRYRRVLGRGAAGSSTNVDMYTASRGHQFMLILYTYLSLLSLFLSLVHVKGSWKREKKF